MILKAKERGGGRQLGLYLLKTDTNEHVAVHDMRGFVSSDLPDALQEVDTICRCTRATNSLFSMSFNPPHEAAVSTEAFEAAIEAVEQKLGLENQPRVIVFHEREGRRHAHAVWSRIDAGKMRAIPLPFYKLKLRDISRDLFFEHGWRMPRGLVDSKERDPLNFSRAEWEQAKRANQDPRALKAMFRECWAIPDSRKAFASALQARGYYLARGNNQRFVAMDYRGAVYNVTKWMGLRTKAVRAKLGEAQDLPSLEQTKSAVADRMSDMLRRHVTAKEAAFDRQATKLALHREQVVARQRGERAALDAAHEKRWAAETADRTKRLSKGFRGIWDRMTGQRGRQTAQNEREALDALRRDRREKDALIEHHLDERRDFHAVAKQLRESHAKDIEDLHCDIARYVRLEAKAVPEIAEHSRDADKPQKERPRRRSKQREPDRSM